MGVLEQVISVRLMMFDEDEEKQELIRLEKLLTFENTPQEAEILSAAQDFLTTLQEIYLASVSSSIETKEKNQKINLLNQYRATLFKQLDTHYQKALRTRFEKGKVSLINR